jgi:hypothetical protein
MKGIEFIDSWKKKRPGRSELRDSAQYKRVLKLIKDDSIPVGKAYQIDFSGKVKREEFPGYEIPARNFRIILIKDIWEDDVLDIGKRRLNYGFILNEIEDGHLLNIVNHGYQQVKATRTMKRRTS